MRLINKKSLIKFKRKNRGNVQLSNAIEKLIQDIEIGDWKNQMELFKSRTDADCVNNEGFYFFNLNSYRTMILVEFNDQEASVVWVGSHKEYESTFKNNKNTIKKWLKSKDWI